MRNNKGLDFSKPLILSGKRDSHPRFACVVSRELYLHPRPLEGEHWGCSVKVSPPTIQNEKDSR